MNERSHQWWGVSPHSSLTATCSILYTWVAVNDFPSIIVNADFRCTAQSLYGPFTLISTQDELEKQPSMRWMLRNHIDDFLIRFLPNAQLFDLIISHICTVKKIHIKLHLYVSKQLHITNRELYAVMSIRTLMNRLIRYFWPCKPRTTAVAEAFHKYEGTQGHKAQKYILQTNLSTIYTYLNSGTLGVFIISLHV